jgi:hypothetical protein
LETLVVDGTTAAAEIARHRQPAKGEGHEALGQPLSGKPSSAVVPLL